MVEDNIHILRKQIEEACEKSNRNPDEVNIIAVTKYVGIEKIEELVTYDFNQFGENRVQDTLEKYETLKDKVTWHFIGQLQSKKVKSIIGKVDYIHSLDRLSLAEELDKRAKSINIDVNCFIQVNVSGEDTKAGVSKEELFAFAKKISEYDSIKVKGLMTMAPNIEDKEKIRAVFRELRELRDVINEKGLFEYKLTELSMGMSNDFDIAIEEGATYIRIGRLLYK